MAHYTGILGLLTMLGLAWLFSSNRRAIRWRTVFWGLGLQLLFAFLVLRSAAGQRLMAAAGAGVNWLLSFAFAGSSLVFGALGQQHSSFGSIFAFQVLPTIIFISALFSVLYALGIMQVLIRIFAQLMQWTLQVSGAESLNVAASIFMGQTEAPLTIRPFLPRATRSELMTIMTSGMAHVSGGIMAAYILYGIEAKHLLAAVIMTAPGTILLSKMLVPETEQPATAGRIVMPRELTAGDVHANGSANAPADGPEGTAAVESSDRPPATSPNGTPAEDHRDANLLAAIARGTIDGGQLAFNVAIMLISFLALIALVNGVFGLVHAHASWFPARLDVLLGWLFAPIAWLIGIPWHAAPLVGSLLGTRAVLNELVAYSVLGAQKAQLDPRSFTVATFALCGFANLSSIGIQIGGIGALAPTRRNDLARLGLRAMLAGTMANLMSASIVGLLLW